MLFSFFKEKYLIIISLKNLLKLYSRHVRTSCAVYAHLHYYEKNVVEKQNSRRKLMAVFFYNKLQSSREIIKQICYAL